LGRLGSTSPRCFATCPAIAPMAPVVVTGLSPPRRRSLAGNSGVSVEGRLSGQYDAAGAQAGAAPPRSPPSAAAVRSRRPSFGRALGVGRRAKGVEDVSRDIGGHGDQASRRASPSDSGYTHLSSLLGLVHGLLCAHELKFTIKLLEALIASRATACMLPLAKADMDEALKRFVVDQRLAPNQDAVQALLAFMGTSSEGHNDSVRARTLEEVPTSFRGQDEASCCPACDKSRAPSKGSVSFVRVRKGRRVSLFRSLQPDTERDKHSETPTHGIRRLSVASATARSVPSGVLELDKQHDTRSEAPTVRRSLSAVPGEVAEGDAWSIDDQAVSRLRTSSESSHEIRFDEITTAPSQMSQVTSEACWVSIRENVDDLSVSQMNWLAKPSPLIWHPNSMLLLAWGMLSLIFILIECAMLPLSLCYNFDLPSDFHMLSTAFFTADIIVSFNTGYFKGCLIVMRRRWVMWHYARTWLFLDVVCTVPWEAILSAFADPEDGQLGQTSGATLFRIAKLGKLMRMARLIRLLKVNSLIMRVMSSGLLPAGVHQLKFGISTAKMFALLAFLAHWSACVWGWIGSPPNDGGQGAPPMDICTMGGPCEPGIEGSPWRRRYGLENHGVIVQHLAALQYNAALITGGESPMQPGNPIERTYVVVMMILSVFVSSIVVGEVLLVMNRQSEMSMQFEDEMQQCREFLVAREMPLSLQVRVYRFLEGQHRLQRRHRSLNRDFIGNLSGWLQVQVVEHLHKDHLLRHPFFKAIGLAEAMRQICLECKAMFFHAGDPVVEEAHLALCAHFLVSGKVRTRPWRASNWQYFRPPCWFGDKSFFVDTLYSHTIFAVSQTETFTVMKATIQRLIERFPQVAPVHEQFRQKVLSDDLDSLRCPHCMEFGHSPEHCPSVYQEDEHKDKDVSRNGIGSRVSLMVKGLAMTFPSSPRDASSEEPTSKQLSEGSENQPSQCSEQRPTSNARAVASAVLSAIRVKGSRRSALS